MKLTHYNPLESDRLAGIIDYLKVETAVKIVIRINGGFTMRNRIPIFFYRMFIANTEYKGKGISDLIGILRDGRFFAFEVKRPGETATGEQLSFLAAVRDAGGVVGIVENWQQARSIIRGE